VLSQFADRRDTAARHYHRFVQEGVGQPSIWKDVHAQALLGEPDFVERLRGHLRGAEAVKEIPRSQRYLGRPTLQQLFDGKLSRARRDALIVRAVARHGYSQREVAETVGLHYSTVSRLANRQRQEARPDPFGGYQGQYLRETWNMSHRHA
jgi:putative transposase